MTIRHDKKPRDHLLVALQRLELSDPASVEQVIGELETYYLLQHPEDIGAHSVSKASNPVSVRRQREKTNMLSRVASYQSRAIRPHRR